MNEKNILLLVGVVGMSWYSWKWIKKLITPNSESIDILARTAWGEARGDGTQGMQAVINVVMNRVERGAWYGENVIDVCKKPKQFSCWNKSDPNYKKMLAITQSDSQFKQAVQLATLAIDGRLPDITDGATNYHAKSVNPYWAKSMTKTATIGNHIFYA